MSASGGLTCGHRNFVAGAIRWFTRFRGEAPVFTNHAFVLRQDGTSGAESLGSGVKPFDHYRDRYDNKKNWCIIFECVEAVREEGRKLDHAVVEAKLDEYMGRAYDKLVIFKCVLDGLTSKVVGHDVFWFRRIKFAFWKREERWNICSWLFCKTHRHGRWKVWGVVVHTVKGKRRGLRRRIRKLERFEPLECRRVAPNDIERDVFIHRRSAYRIIDECGVRPKRLPQSYITKIEADLEMVAKRRRATV